MVNTLKIKARIKELGLTQKSIAERIGISYSTINRKINNVRSMTSSDADKLSSALYINDKDFMEYFFSNF